MPVAHPNLALLREKPSAWFGVVAGVFAGLVLLKFGNPITLEHLTERPADFTEAIFSIWPLNWGFGLLMAFSVVACFFARWQSNVPRWAWVLPLGWLGWQFVSATQTVDQSLTTLTLKHFVACVGCYFVGIFALRRAEPSLFLSGLALGLLLVLASGFNQHYGGLEQTRRFFYEQMQAGAIHPRPEMIAKVASDRIFATLIYPNALAGVILLLLPPVLALGWRIKSNVLRGVCVGGIAYAALACLYWSGSKSGWLIALAMGLVALLQLSFSRRLKLGLVVGILAVGLVAFFVRFDAYFKKGATSVGARFDYWRAAILTVKEKPLVGSGPGTFYIAYRKVKPPEAEMARLTHNDFLQQATDSGLPGFVVYCVWIGGSIIVLYRKRSLATSWIFFPVWLGLLGWFVQGGVEFGLYIPAEAWLAYLLLGWIWSEIPINRTVGTTISPNRVKSK